MPRASVAPPTGGSPLWRVYTGPYPSRLEAEAAWARMSRSDLGPGLVLQGLQGAPHKDTAGWGCARALKKLLA